MDATKLEAYLAIPMPSIEIFGKPDDKDNGRTVLYDAIDDLCACSDKLEFRLGVGIIKPGICLLEGAARKGIVQRLRFTKKHLERCEILVISTSVPLSLYDDITWSGDEGDKDDVTRWLANVYFCKRISDLLVMSNVGYVGAIALLHSVIVQDGAPVDFSHIPVMDAWSVQRATDAAKQMGWPRLEVLDIQTIWNWVSKDYEMLEGFDGNGMSRALCAFSRLFEHKNCR